MQEWVCWAGSPEHDACLRAGLVPVRDDVVVRRDLVRDLPPTGVVLRPAQADIEGLVARTMEGSANRDVAPDRADGHLARWREVEGRAWFEAWDRGRRVGVALLEPGAASYLGVLPHLRGRGLGTALHAAALQWLAPDPYEDMTDWLNVPMRRVFARNGCIEVGRILAFVDPTTRSPERGQ